MNLTELIGKRVRVRVQLGASESIFNGVVESADDAAGVFEMTDKFGAKQIFNVKQILHLAELNGNEGWEKP